MWIVRILKSSVTRRAIIAFTILTFIPLATISAISTRNSSLIIRNQVVKAKENTIVQLKNNLSSVLTQYYSTMSVLVADDSLVRLLRHPFSNTAKDLLDLNALISKVSAAVISYDKKNFMDIILRGRNGICIISGEAGTLIKYDAGKEWIFSNPWYEYLAKKPEEAMVFAGGNGITTTFDAHCFTIAKQLVMPTTGEVYGLITITQKESALGSLFDGMNEAGSTIEIIDSRGIIISSTDSDRIGGVGVNISGIQNAYINIGGEECLICVSRIMPSKFTIYEFISTKELTRYSRRVDRAVSIAAIVSGIICIIFTFCFVNSLMNPFFALLSRVRRKNGLEADDAATGDLFELNVEYDRLNQILEKTMDALVETQQKKRDAEFMVLQMQINPHFINNTLSSIKCLVWTGQTEKVEQVINSLSEILRMTMTDQNALMPLRQSIEIARKYLSIQEIRLKRGIRLHVTCGNLEYYDYMLPKLLLQPLFENAVFHGIEPSDVDAVISIDISRSEDGQYMRILVKDNGVGIKKEDIPNVFDGTYSDRTHIGLKNVKERIKLFFGASGELKIFPGEKSGTVVDISLPFKGGDVQQ